MNNRINTVFIALILAAGVLGLAACASKKDTAMDQEAAVFADLRAEISAVVDNREREQRALVLIDELQRSYDQLQDEIALRQEALRELNRDYDASRAAFEHKLGLFEKAIQDNEIRMTDIRRQLVGVLTESEWQELEKTRNQAVERALRLGQAI